MTFTGRIRAYLVLTAIVPPLLVMSVIYFHSVRQLEDADRRRAHTGLMKGSVFLDAYASDLTRCVAELSTSSRLRQAVLLLQSSRSDEVELDPRPYGLDFLEILNSDHRVMASFHRPGLLGQKVHPLIETTAQDTAESQLTVEYDVEGGHAAHTFMRPLSASRYLYTGRYMGSVLQNRLAEVLDADIDLFIEPDTPLVYSQMETATLYEAQGMYRAVLAQGPKGEFYLTATFPAGAERPLFLSLLGMTGVVAVLGAAIAIGLGLVITGRAKREIENLLMASERVASGDFATPVMAYEEGEFARLADSLSETMIKLRFLQQRLATTEKIAAWQTVGRKVAHEIKNPLTPIGISVDDLRRSFHEKLPDFGRTLEDTTATIKSEVARMTRLLDEFVGFARMGPPQVQRVSSQELLEGIGTLYRQELAAGRLVVNDATSRRHLRLDPNGIKQVLINLIKNGFEADDDAVVALTLSDVNSDIAFAVEDNGPGFSGEKLLDSFEPFASTKKGGSGLGLVICHRIVHDHGGTMELYNRVEGGAGVRIRLPQ